MTDERKRILRMLAEGQISIDECEELLRALGHRKAERVEKEIEKARRGKRPVWPYVLLGLLVVWGAFVNLGLPLLWPPMYFWQWLRLPVKLHGFYSIFQIGLFALWIWMVIDCMTRDPSEFRLLFTQRFSYEKWIWLAIVVFGQAIGAIVYFVVIREPARSLSPPDPLEREPEDGQGFLPRRRARSLLPWLAILTLLLALAASAPWILDFAQRSFASNAVLRRTHAFGPYRSVAHGLRVAFLPLALCGALFFVFWLWMLIDCLSRDYREFGALISSDRSADKVIWLLMILCLPLIGAIAYHIGIRRRPPESRGATAQ